MRERRGKEGGVRKRRKKDGEGGREVEGKR